MRTILGAIGVTLAVGVLSAFAIAGLGDGTQVYQATMDSARLAGASAELEVDGDNATLVADGVPEPEGAYQVWIKRPGVENPQPSELFLPRNGEATVAIPDAEDAAAILVTRELRAGDGRPSEDPVISISLA
jgi:hypothetical protein